MISFIEWTMMDSVGRARAYLDGFTHQREQTGRALIGAGYTNGQARAFQDGADAARRGDDRLAEIMRRVYNLD